MKASLLIVAGVIAGSGVAYADGDVPPPPTTDAGSATATPPPTLEPGGWATIDSRPLTLPTGRLAIDGVFPFFNVSVFDPVTMMTVNNFAIGAVIEGTYGINDKLEVGAGYGFSLDSFDATPVLDIRGAYAALHSDKFDLAVAADFSFDTHSSGAIVLGLGGWFRYRIIPKLSLFTGMPGMIPQVGGGIGAFFFGPIGYQLLIELNNKNPVDLAIPVGASYQITPQIYAYAQLVLMDLQLNGGNNAFIFSDFIPITLGAYYSLDNPKLDIGLAFGDDFKNAGDFYAFTLSARYWVK
jgi:hypothetical protein